MGNPNDKLTLEAIRELPGNTPVTLEMIRIAINPQLKDLNEGLTALEESVKTLDETVATITELVNAQNATGAGPAPDAAQLRDMVQGIVDGALGTLTKDIERLKNVTGPAKTGADAKADYEARLAREGKTFDGARMMYHPTLPCKAALNPQDAGKLRAQGYQDSIADAALDAARAELGIKPGDKKAVPQELVDKHAQAIHARGDKPAAAAA